MKYSWIVGIVFVASSFVACDQQVEQTSILDADYPKAELPPDTMLTPAQEAKAEQLDAFFAKKFKEKGFNGTVLMAEEGKVVYKDAFGYANKSRKNRDTLTVNHAFQLASISKPFTAYAILVLKDQGKVDLDHNVRKYLPNFPYDGITVRMLLSHRSGMCNYMYFADEVWPDRFVNPIHNDDVLRLMAEHVPMQYYPPNTKYDYSNSGFMVAASIVEKVSGKSFEKFMADEVFGPIGMENSWIYRKGKTAHKDHPIAIGYDSRGRVAEDTYLNGVVGDKGVYSTVLDMLKFDQAIYDGFPVSKETMAEAFSPENEERKNKDNYGLGWRIKKAQDDQRTIIYHTGWWKGFRTYFLRDIENEKTLIILDNYKRGKFLKVNDLVDLMNASPEA